MENLKNNTSQEGNHKFDLLDIFPRMNNGFNKEEAIEVNFEEDIDLSKILDTIEFNEIDKIFKEIKSSIIN